MTEALNEQQLKDLATDIDEGISMIVEREHYYQLEAQAKSATVNKWKIRFVFLLAYLIGCWVGGTAERTERWFYMGSDAAKYESAALGIYTGE